MERRNRKNAAPKTNAAPTTKMIECHSAIRNPTVREKRLTRAKNIAYTTQGVDEFAGEVFVDLVAQAAHQHVDDVCLRIETVVPQTLQQEGLRKRFSFVSHQLLQQRELARL